MSRLKLNALRNTAGTTDSLSINADGSVSTLGGKVSPFTGFKNHIINGDMRIDQRNNGATVTASSTFVVDRIISIERSGYTTLAVSSQQSTDVPPGFTRSVKVTVNTGQAASSSSQINAIDHRIEGHNFADFNFGTANASPFTLSFLVKSSIPGLYPVSFFNQGVTRAYLATYTINAANTWEYKTITVPGDTAGTWDASNLIGLGMQFCVAGGANNAGTPGAWSGTYKPAVAGMVDLGATTGATFAITGLQLERGTVATEFERRDYGRELAMCQRYYFYTGATYGNGVFNNGLYTSCQFPVVMRAAPTVTLLVQSGSPGSVSQANTTGWYGFGGGGASAIQWKAEVEL